MSSTAKKSGARKKAAAGRDWHSDAPLNTEGQRMRHVGQCAKWFKTQIDRDRVVSKPSMTPRRHPLPTVSGAWSTTDCVAVLRSQAYDALPVHPNVAVACVFCQCALPSVCPKDLVCWKNSYSRRSWTVMCPACSEKTSLEKANVPAP